MYFVLTNAAILPIRFSLSSFKIHLFAVPYLKALFFSGSKTAFTSLFRGLIYFGLSLFIKTLIFIKLFAVALSLTTVICIMRPFCLQFKIMNVRAYFLV